MLLVVTNALPHWLQGPFPLFDNTDTMPGTWAGCVRAGAAYTFDEKWM